MVPRLPRDCGIHAKTRESLSTRILHFFSDHVGVLGIQKGSLKKLGTIAVEDRQLLLWKCNFKFILSKFQETSAYSAT